MAECPVCTVETETPHDDEACVDALISSGLFAKFPWFRFTPPPPDKWSDKERLFAHDISLQAIRWKKAELEQT